MNLVDRILQAVGEHEGFSLTEEQCRSRGIRFPTRAQINCNPGNIRRWSRGGKALPTRAGYVDFAAMFPGDRERALKEGWDVLRTLVRQYVDGQYHEGHSPTLREMFAVYAPATDNNDPLVYAETVARKCGVSPDVALADLIA
jgi:hypothetical protein